MWQVLLQLSCNCNIPDIEMKVLIVLKSLENRGRDWLSNSTPVAPFTNMAQFFIPAWVSNHMPNKLWDEITYPFPNFNSATIKDWEWISNTSHTL